MLVMIIGKLCCSLIQARKSILAPFPKSAHHKMNQNSGNAPQNDSFVFSYFQTEGIFTGLAQKCFQSTSFQGILNSFQENRNINGDHGWRLRLRHDPSLHLNALQFSILKPTLARRVDYETKIVALQKDK